jgi:hypothetical protein
MGAGMHAGYTANASAGWNDWYGLGNQAAANYAYAHGANNPAAGYSYVNPNQFAKTLSEKMANLAVVPNGYDYSAHQAGGNMQAGAGGLQQRQAHHQNGTAAVGVTAAPLQRYAHQY